MVARKLNSGFVVHGKFEVPRARDSQRHGFAVIQKSDIFDEKPLFVGTGQAEDLQAPGE